MHDLQSWKYVMKQAFSSKSVYSTFRWISIVFLLVSIITYLFAYKYGHFTSSLPLIVESIILILVLVLNCAIIFWNSRSRYLELYNKAKKLAEKIRCCYDCEELIQQWTSSNFYPHLNTPTSPCISLQWTFRDGKLVNLPTALLVTGDVILLNPGRSVPAKCRRIDKVVKRQKKLSDYNLDNLEDGQWNHTNTFTYIFDDSVKDSSLLRGEIYAPKVDHPSDSFTFPRMRRAVKPCNYLILETPYISDLKAILSIHSHRRTPTAFEKELRLIFVHYLEYLLVPCIVVLVLIFSVIHYCYVEFTSSNVDTGAATIVLIFLRPIMAIIPLLPLALPVLWLVLNVFGLIKLDSAYENFCLNEDKLKSDSAEYLETDYLNTQDDIVLGKFKQNYFLEEIDPDKLSKSMPKNELKLKRILKELFSFLYNDNGNLWRTANLLHVFGSITALCCVDKKGILSWPNPTADKVFFLTAPNQSKNFEKQEDSLDLENVNDHLLNEQNKRNCMYILLFNLLLLLYSLF